MPAYYRVNIDGSYGGFTETWSTSFAVTGPASVPSTANLSAWADAIMTLLAGTSGGVATLKDWISSNGRIDRVRIYWYPEVGAPAGAAGVSSAAAVTGSGTFDHPPQVAIVVGLLTGVPGASGRGRMYWPGVGAAVNTAGKTTAAGSTTATNLAATLEAMATPTGPLETGVLALVSQELGTVTPVTSIRIGDVLDTQRRRRDALVETYYSAPI